ncbi:hypothetical protein [Nannocystis punicea]|uniref:Uncharacterized protein n=1 Tax=Nannocystis punicea TaxID=2995304 RepID=A0ABY7GWA7_9BACT|nr:hypothetical protein [Nannocystis poenicansa]WAS91259.1 hypothetical protein O0S08_34160 [Nannocystis poenicansa]
MSDLELHIPPPRELTRAWHRSVTLTVPPADVLEHLRQVLPTVADGRYRPVLTVDGETFRWQLRPTKEKQLGLEIFGVLHKRDDGGSRLDLHWEGLLPKPLQLLADPLLMGAALAVFLFLALSWPLAIVFGLLLLVRAVVVLDQDRSDVRAAIAEMVRTLAVAVRPLELPAAPGSYREAHEVGPESERAQP